MRATSLILSFFLLGAFEGALRAQTRPVETQPENNARNANLIRISIGEKRTILIEGEFPFLEDDTIAQVEGSNPGEVTLLGLRAGITQVFFLKNGNVFYRDLEVIPPSGLFQPSYGPHYIHNKPYFVYEFQNDAAFTEHSFYDRPAFNHSLYSSIPLANGGHISSNILFGHLGDNNGDLRTANVFYQDAYRRFSFGDSSVSFAKIFGETLGGTSIVGSNLQFRNSNVFGGFQQEINVFGGVKKTLDLFDLGTDGQLYGAGYYLYRRVEGSLQPDVFNTSIFTYQDPIRGRFRFAGILEENFHLTPEFSLGAGLTRLHGGWVAGVAPIFQKKDTIFQSRYIYYDHGLQPLLGPPLQNDLHTVQLSFQQYLKNRAYLFGASLFGNVSVEGPSSLIPGSNNQSAQVYLRRNSSFRRDYTLSYGISRSSVASKTILSNFLSGSFSYPATSTLYITHGLGYSRNDLDREDNIISASTGFHFESTRLRFDFNVATGASINSEDYRQSLSFNDSFQFNVPRGNLKINFNYIKADFSDRHHEFQLTPSWNIQITSTHLLSFISSLYFLAREDHQLNGFIGVRYRYTFGPGVESDSPLKIFGGRRVGYQPVEGDLFLDNNYNTFFDEGDEALAGVPVKLDGKSVKTDAQGHFLFPNVKTGTYDLSVDTKNLANTNLAGQPLDLSSSQKVTTYENQTMVVPIPVSIKKSEILVRLFLDTNDNGTLDRDDTVLNLPKVLLKDPKTGTTREIKAFHGEAIIRGVDVGDVQVALDPTDIPEDVELQGELAQLRSVTTESEKYETNFFFRPVRSLRGQVLVGAGKILPKNLEIRLGDHVSAVDKDGYYWVKNISVGKYPLVLKNLPPNLCVEGTLPENVSVPGGPFLMNVNIRLKECVR